MPALIAVDAGTTGVRAFAVDAEGRPCGFSYRELTQHFPRPGWVEHDADEIWTAVQTTLAELAGRLADEGVAVAAVGITNQRETVVAWDRRTGRPLHRALGWQGRGAPARPTGRGCGSPGARPPAATRCGRRATSRRSGPPPGSCSTPTSRPRRWN